MKKIKYKVIKSEKEIPESRLNALGSQGWELCSVIYYENFGFTYYIKKEIKTNG